MPNPIKYSTGSESDALKKGNLYIGTGAVGKGPSDTTGYYQGPSVPTNGYVIYMNKVGAPGGLSYHSASNDSELISFTNSLAGESFTTAQQCFDYYYGQTDKVLVTQDYPADFPYIVLDGLVLYLDAGISQSYPGSGTVWTDINGLGPKTNGTLTNGPTFNSANGGSIVFDGTNDYVNCGGTIPSLVGKVNITASLWIKFNSEIESFVLPIGKYNFPIGWEGFWFSDGKVAFGGRESSASYLYTGQSSLSVCPAGSTIYNVVYHKNGSLWSVYVDGNLVISTSLGLGNVSIYSGVDLEIGRAEGGYNANCNIYITQIYNRALTESEILQNFNAQKGRFGL